MLFQTKQSINSQKEEIVALAYQAFGATFVNVLNGATVGPKTANVQDVTRYTALKRSLHGHAHLRFCKAYNIVKGSIHRLKSEDFEYNYIYFTQSTTFDKRSKLELKIEKNLSDCCFNIRREVIDCNADLNNFYILVDTGVFYCLISKKEARENIIDLHNYNGRECYKIRLPKRFIRKSDLTNRKTSSFLRTFGTCPDSFISFDAKYIENDNYGSKYKASKAGFIKVENYLNSELQAIQYFISAQACADFFAEHGSKHKKNYYWSLARNNESIVTGAREFVFSRVSEINEKPVNNTSESSASCISSREDESITVFKQLINNKNTVMGTTSPASREDIIEDKQIEEVQEIDSSNDFQCFSNWDYAGFRNFDTEKPEEKPRTVSFPPRDLD